MAGNELDEIMSEEVETVDTESQTEDVKETENEPVETKANGDESPEANEEQVEETEETPTQETVEESTVPQQALHASRQREKEAKQEAEEYRRQIAQMQGQIEMLSRQMQQPQNTQQQPAPEPPDPYADPGAFTEYALQQQLAPLNQGISDRFEQLSRTLAEDKYGAETVESAMQDLGNALRSGDASAYGEYQRIMASAHPYSELVGWHKQRQTLQRVGSDPDAYFQSEFERRMAEDPDFMKTVTEKITGQAKQANGRPSTETPRTQLPPSLNRVATGGNSAQQFDMSDEGLFNDALR